MDFFGIGARRKRAALIEKLLDLHAVYQEQFDDARDALFDAMNDDDGFFDAYESKEDHVERIAERVYAAATKMEMIQSRLEELEAA